MRVQGWDPVLLICQIISMQTIHYLSLSTLLPPLLSTLTSPALLTYSGGPSTVAHVLDWREMAARPTVSSSSFRDVDFGNSNSKSGGYDTLRGWRKLRGAWAGGKKVGEVKLEPGPSGAGGNGDLSDGIGSGTKGHTEVEEEEEVWDYGVDDSRGWVIAIAWLVASGVDILPLYYLVRRPTHILDFALTLTFNHLILTTYYAKSFPTSLFFWIVQALGALLMIVVAEQLCVKREMNTDLEVAWDPENVPLDEEIELDQR